MPRRWTLAAAPLLTACLLAGCSGATSTSQPLPTPAATSSAGPVLPSATTAVPGTVGAPGTPTPSGSSPVPPSGAATSSSPTPAPSAPALVDLVADPKLVWSQPPGLDAEQRAAVDAYHLYWLRFNAAAATGDTGYAPLYAVATGDVATSTERLLASVPHGVTGTLTVHVYGATVTAANSVGVSACVDQSVAYAKDVGGKAIVAHTANSKVTTLAGMRLRTGRGWQYAVPGASASGCA